MTTRLLRSMGIELTRNQALLILGLSICCVLVGLVLVALARKLQKNADERQR